MLNVAATRENLKQWIQSPDFERYCETAFPFPKLRFILGGILTVSPAFPVGIGLLVNGFRKRKKQKEARLLVKAEAAQWELVVCSIVIANAAALATPGSRAPSALVGAFGLCDEGYLDALFDLMMKIGDLYGSDPKQVASEYREMATLINDDVYHANRRRPVPVNLTKGRPFLLFDAILESNYFESNQIDNPVVVCASNPLRESPIVHLPPHLLVWEQEEQPYDPNIIRHSEPKTNAPIVAPVSENLEPLETHIERYFGTPETVFHEIVSTTVHIDLHFIPATQERPWHTIVTTGMSDIPMTTPEGAEEFQLAELLLRLPPSWPLSQEAFEDEKSYWPLRQLKFLARFAHEYETWLCYGHTIPNGNPPEVYTNGVPFSGVLLSDPFDVYQSV